MASTEQDQVWRLVDILIALSPLHPGQARLSPPRLGSSLASITDTFECCSSEPNFNGHPLFYPAYDWQLYHSNCPDANETFVRYRLRSCLLLASSPPLSLLLSFSQTSSRPPLVTETTETNCLEICAHSRFARWHGNEAPKIVDEIRQQFLFGRYLQAN